VVSDTRNQSTGSFGPRRVDDELRFSIDILKRICATRGDIKRLGELIDIAFTAFMEDRQKAAGQLLELVETLERVIKSEQMEVLYPFENIKEATHEFGVSFLEGYFDWRQVSGDPYEIIALIEKMLDEIETAKSYAKKAQSELRVLSKKSD